MAPPSLTISRMKILNCFEAPPSTHLAWVGWLWLRGAEGGKPDVDFGLLETLANRRRRKESPQQKQPLWPGPGCGQGGVEWMSDEALGLEEGLVLGCTHPSLCRPEGRLTSTFSLGLLH